MVKLTDLQQKQKFLIELITYKGMVSEAMAHARIDQKQLSEWLRKDKEFNQQVNDIKVDVIEEALIQSCLNGNVKAQIYFLDTHGKSRGYGIQGEDPEQTRIELDKPIYKVMENVDKFFIPSPETAIKKRTKKDLPKFAEEE